MDGKIAFIQEFRATATHLRTYEITGKWLTLRDEIGPALTAAEAAAWADLGYRPEEAAPQIRSGITAAMANEMEDHAEEQAGGKDELAGQRIAELINGGALTPADVIVDPTDPGNEIVVLPPGWDAD